MRLLSFAQALREPSWFIRFSSGARRCVCQNRGGTTEVSPLSSLDEGGFCLLGKNPKTCQVSENLAGLGVWWIGRSDMEGTVKLMVRLPSDLYEQLRRRATESGKSLNQTIVEAIQRGLDVLEKIEATRETS